MKNQLSLVIISLLLPLSASGADALDFPEAAFRIKTGGQSLIVRASSPAKETKIDGKNARTGEIISNAIKIEWLIAPSPQVGDEYVFIVRRAKEKPKTYSAVFKGGYLSLVGQDDLIVEIENP